MIKTDMSTRFDWQDWRSAPEDLAAIDLPITKQILFNILLINEFERAVLELKNAQCVWGPVHCSIGQEAVAAASIAALRRQDKIVGSHRAHHEFLAKLLGCVDWDPCRQDVPEAALDVVRRTLAEIMGLAPGYCGGRGGSMHLRHAEAGVVGTNAIVGGGTALAAGAAFAERFRGVDGVVVCFLGDGAVNQGVFHEACNLAGLWRLPIIYFVENNHYAVATRSDQASAVADLSVRAIAYGMSGRIVNGMDPVAIYAAVKEAAEDIRTGGRPSMIEAKCYRHFHHAGGLVGSAYRYRSKEEEAQWLAIDAVKKFPADVVAAGLLPQSDVLRIADAAKSAVLQAVDYCTVQNGSRTVRPELWPSPQTLHEGVRSDGREWSGVVFRERQHFDKVVNMKYSHAVAAVIGRWLDKDDRVVVLGEDVANFGGGAFGATRQLAQKHPNRVLNTPISEAGFVGLACGTAMSGLRPVVEIMYPDFSLVAADQLFNQAAKLRYLYGNTLDMPLVARTRVSIGCGYGAQHSMDPVALYALFPGWRVVYPSNAFDYIGLFNSAMRSLDPTLLIEHHAFYAREFPVPESDWDYCIAFGKAKVIAQGKNITLVTYGPMVGRCEEMALTLASQNISAEIIDLRTVDPVSIDYETVGLSVARTRAVAIVEEAPRSQSLGAVLAAEITERFFDNLDCPVLRVCSQDVPSPVSRVLESAAIIDDASVLSSLVKLACRRNRMPP